MIGQAKSNFTGLHSIRMPYQRRKKWILSAEQADLLTDTLLSSYVWFKSHKLPHYSILPSKALSFKNH